MLELGVLFIVISDVWWVLHHPRTGRPRGPMI